jgi:hypothetical protein
MGDLDKQITATRTAINDTTQALRGLHQRSEAAVQLRAHLQQLMNIERALLATVTLSHGVTPSDGSQP